METNFMIGLCFSGGGYRAAGFSLGTLSYLNEVSFENDRLLKHVVALSTVSGGTITGIRYALAAQRNEPFETFYQQLMETMKSVDLPVLSLDRLTCSDEEWPKERVRSLICAIADVYDNKLFDKARFGELMKDGDTSHLKHLSFNATEFANGLQFRFQWSEKVRHMVAGPPERGMIGNKNINIPEAIAANIRLADILAASSCFPGGFEPINFPTDFDLPDTSKTHLATNNEMQLPIGLMDGGIVDNQGIEPILLADARMRINEAHRPESERRSPVLDLIVISDVASPFMAAFAASKQKPAKGWRRFTPLTIFVVNTIILLGTGFLLWRAVAHKQIVQTIIFTAVCTLSLVIFLIGRILGGLPAKLDVPEQFLKPMGKLLRLRLQVYENLILNRLNSVMMMSGEVFLKHVRRLNFRSIYTTAEWKNRRIMTAIYELKDKSQRWNTKIAAGEVAEAVKPNEGILATAAKASSMKTTLWFTGEEVDGKMPEALIATGQFTLCWNLLEHIGKLKMDPKNVTQEHLKLITLEDTLLVHWNQFLADPYWLVNQLAGKQDFTTI